MSRNEILNLKCQCGVYFTWRWCHL